MAIEEEASSGRVTVLLSRWTEGDENALHDLISLVYGELRQVARNRLAAERSGHSLAPTDLVHEAYERLVHVEIPWRDRVHFFAVAAGTMRRILVDRARSRYAEKRGGGVQKVTLGGDEALAADDFETMLALHHALERLEKKDARKARALELHFFSGLTYEEIAQTLEISLATVERDLRFARAWLQKELAR